METVDGSRSPSGSSSSCRPRAELELGEVVMCLPGPGPPRSGRGSRRCRFLLLRSRRAARSRPGRSRRAPWRPRRREGSAPGPVSSRSGRAGDARPPAGAAARLPRGFPGTTGSLCRGVASAEVIGHRFTSHGNPSRLPNRAAKALRSAGEETGSRESTSPSPPDSPVSPPGRIARERAHPAPQSGRADPQRRVPPRGGRWQGRRAGSPGADAAADWIGGEFRRLGSSRPVTGDVLPILHLHRRRRARSGQPARGGLRTFKPGEEFRPLAFSSPGAVAGELAFAGYGIVAKDLDYDDYAGLDVRDRVVLLLRFAPARRPAVEMGRPSCRCASRFRRRGNAGPARFSSSPGRATPNVPDQLVPRAPTPPWPIPGSPLHGHPGGAEALSRDRVRPWKRPRRKIDESRTGSLALPACGSRPPPT